MNENVGNTSAKKEEEKIESKNSFCLFENKDSKENNPIQIINKKSLYQSQIIIPEGNKDNKKIIKENYLNIFDNNLINNDKKSINPKTQFIKNKKNSCIFKSNINLNMRDDNDSIIGNKSIDNKNNDNKNNDNKSSDNKSIDNKNIDNKINDNKSIINKSIDNKIIYNIDNNIDNQNNNKNNDFNINNNNYNNGKNNNNLLNNKNNINNNENNININNTNNNNNKGNNNSDNNENHINHINISNRNNNINNNINNNNININNINDNNENNNINNSNNNSNINNNLNNIKINNNIINIEQGPKNNNNDNNNNDKQLNNINNHNNNINNNNIININNNDNKNMNNNIINNNIINDNNIKDNNSKDDLLNGENNNNLINDIKNKEQAKNKIDIKDINQMQYKTQIIKKSKKYEEEIKINKLEDAKIKDHFKCNICHNILKKPRMCKFCKKTACEECLKKWVNDKNKCPVCQKKIKYSDTISIPILDDLSYYYMNKIEKAPINPNNNINKKEGNNNMGICKEHKTQYEFFCFQCNKKYCSKCLVFFNETSKIHNNHLIIKLEEMKNKEIKEQLDEYKKLNVTKKNIEDFISLCNLKKRELEIENSQITNNLDSIKNFINDKFDHKLNNIKKRNNYLKSTKDQIENAVESTPHALKNIIKSRDYGQGDKIYEHIKSINKNIEKNYDDINLHFKNHFIEAFTSELIEFTLPNGGKYAENLKIFNKKMDNFIPDNECQIILNFKDQNISFNINIKNINNPNINNQDIKYYGFIIIRNKKFDCEFIPIDDNATSLRHTLFAQFRANHFISFKDENNIIRFKIYILKHETKIYK